VLDFLHQRFQKRVPLIGVVDLPASTSPEVAEKRRTELQGWLSSQPELASHFVRAIAVSSFVRFRLDGSLDLERDERRNIRELAELMTRELPDDAQVEMARLFGAKEVQKDLSNRLIRAVTAMSAAIGAQPIPLADFPILTTLQFMMVAGVMHISGRELSLKAAGEFIGALGMNIGVGMAFREGARAAVKLLPGWGNAGREFRCRLPRRPRSWPWAPAGPPGARPRSRPGRGPRGYGPRRCAVRLNCARRPCAY